MAAFPFGRMRLVRTGFIAASFLRGAMRTAAVYVLDDNVPASILLPAYGACRHYRCGHADRVASSIDHGLVESEEERGKTR